MRVRWIGLTLVLAVAGGAVGYELGAPDDPAPVAFEPAAPVPASDPALPFDVVRVDPDPIYPTLEPGIALVPQRLGTRPFDVTMPTPKGWPRTNPTAGEWRWFPDDPLDVLNTYFVRLRLVGNGYSSVPAALDSRITALRDAPEVKDFTLEQRDRTSFVATYVAEAHRRVAFERFFPDADGFAYAYVAVIGREQDRAGLADLFARISTGLDTSP